MKTHQVLGTAVAALTVLACAAPRASAAVIFATFTEDATSQGFTFANNGGTSGSISASTPIDFEFTTASGLPTTVHNATLTISGPATFTPASTFGPLLNQPLSSLDTLSIIEIGTGTNLLTMTFTGNITGFTGGPSASITGADTLANTVNYTSSLLTLTGPGNSFNLGLADISVPFSVGPGGFLNSLIANIDGQFTAGNASGGNPGPEPASLGILALGTAALITRRRNA